MMRAVIESRSIMRSSVFSVVGSRWFIVGLLLLATIGWFATLPPGILIGDDLALVHAVQSGHLGVVSALFVVGDWNKFRPISNLLFAVVIPIAGNRFAIYETVNLFVQCASALVVAAIVLRATHRNMVLAICTGLVFTTSRFAYYQIIQATGLFEGVSLLFALIALYHVVCAYRLGLGSQFPRTVFWSVLAVLTDERYLAMLPFVAAAAFLFPRSGEQRRAARASGFASIAVLVLYYVFKHRVLHADFVSATSGQSLILAPALLFSALRDAMANVLGFNIGPDYLSGKDVSELGWPGYLFGVLAAIGPLSAMLLWVRRNGMSDRGSFFRFGFLALAAFGPLLASACVSSRMEFRWLYAGYTMFILTAACAAGALRVDARRLTVAAVATTVILVGESLYYRQYLHNMYFAYEMSWGTLLRDTLASDSPEEAVIVTNGDSSVDLWTFAGRQFLDEYDFGATRVSYVASPSDLNSADAAADVFEKVGIDMVARRRVVGRRRVVPLSKPVAEMSAAIPEGIVITSPIATSGIYPAQGGEGCCWTGRDVRFAVRVRDRGAHAITLMLYIPKAGPFVRRAQSVALLGNGDKVLARATLPSDDSTMVRFALPKGTPPGLTQLHLRFDRSFVPAKSGTGGDVRDLAAVLQSVVVR